MKIDTKNIIRELSSFSRERDIDDFIAKWNLDTKHIPGRNSKIGHIREWLESVNLVSKTAEDCRLGPYFYTLSIDKDAPKVVFRTIRRPFWQSVSEQVWHQDNGYPMPMPFIDRENAAMRDLFSRSQLAYFQMAQDMYGIPDVRLVPEILCGKNVAKLYTPFMKRVLNSLVSAGDNLDTLKHVLNSYGIGWIETRKTFNLSNLREINLYDKVVADLRFDPNELSGLYSLDIIDYLEKLSDRELLRTLDHYGHDVRDDRLLSIPFVRALLESFGLISKDIAAQSYRRSDITRDILVILNKKNILKTRISAK